MIDNIKFNLQDYMQFALSSTVLSIFFYILVNMRRGLIVQYAPVYRMRYGRLRFPFFVLMKKKAKAAFTIRKLYPKYVGRIRSKRIKRS
tara:strand:- start:203 stop:469 length:267 start_codon:yes stop_codon:yes gene_type:complete